MEEHARVGGLRPDGSLRFGRTIAKAFGLDAATREHVTPVQAVFLIAGSLAIALYVRQRTRTMRQIQARLSGIEEQLRELAQKK